MDSSFISDMGCIQVKVLDAKVFGKAELDVVSSKRNYSDTSVVTGTDVKVISDKMDDLLRSHAKFSKCKN